MNTVATAKAAMHANCVAISEFVKDESGVTAIEYAFIAAATGLALAAVMPTIKSNLSVKFTAISDNLQ